MNEEVKEVKADTATVSSMNRGGAAAAPAGNSEVEDLRRQLQSAKVEAGRVKALSQQLRDRDEEIAQLKAQLEEARASAPRDYMADIPEDMRDSVDETQLKAVGRMMDKRLRERDEQLRQREDEIRRTAEEREAQTRQFREQAIKRMIERDFPGFIQATNQGGDKYEPWMRFLNTYGASVRDAYNSFNYDALSNLIAAFHREIGVPANRNAGTALTPTPTLSDGAQGAVEGKVYTFAEYQTTLEKAGEDFRAGMIDRAKYTAIRAELEKAVNEGRVTR